MEISLQNKSAAPLSKNLNGHGAAVGNTDPEPHRRFSMQPLSLPTQFGVAGAVTEAKIGALKAGKSEPHIFDRTLKPYDTVMLPHSAADEKRLQRMA